MKLATDSSSQS